MTLAQSIAGKVAGYMKQFGFARKRKLFYKIENDIAYCIEFDSPGGILYVTFYIMPLYIPADTRYYSYGNRLNSISTKPLSLLRISAGPNEVADWCEEYYDTVNRYVFPLFDQISSPEKLLSYLNSLTDSKIIHDFFCQPYLLSRLKLYTYLYLNEMDALQHQLSIYRQSVLSVTTLIDQVRENYLKEAKTIEEISFLSTEQRILFCRNTIANTRQKCIG